MKIRKIFDNIEIKLVCLFLAIVMWLYASGSTEIVNRARTAILRGDRGRITFREVPIELRGSKEDAKLVAHPSKISLEVLCPMTAEIDATDFRAVVTVTRKDKNRIQLNAKNVILPKGLSFVRAEPEEIQISSKPEIERE